MNEDNEKERHKGLGRIASTATGAVEVTAGAAVGVVSKGLEGVTHHLAALAIPGIKKQGGGENKEARVDQKATKSKNDFGIEKGELRSTDTVVNEPKQTTVTTSSIAVPAVKAAAPSPPKLARACSDPITGASPSHIKHQLGIRSSHYDNYPTVHDGHEDGGGDDESSNNGKVFHNDKGFKITVVYWRHGFGLPENGSIRIQDTTFTFKGIIGTRLTIPLEDIVRVEKASRMGGLVQDAIRIRVKPKNVSSTTLTHDKEVEGQNEKEEKHLFTTVLMHRKEVIEKIQLAIASVTLSKKVEEFDDNTAKDSSGGEQGAKNRVPLFRMPPDPILQKMTKIAKQKLQGVSLQDYYEVAWSEGVNCDKKPMYGPFLESCGKNNVHVNQWETGGEYNGEWCGETYSQQRFVTFNFMKQTIGQTLVEVKHTQRCRRLNNDQCIVHMTLEMKGFPYADCFVVEVRHVASRVGENDLQVEIGLFVKFLKSCMFESKIRSNTEAETTKAQVDLLGRIVQGCEPYAKKVVGVPEEETDEEEEDDADALKETVALIKLTKGAGRPLELPDAIVNALRMVMMVFVMFFRAFIRPYIQPELLNPFPPSTLEEALQSVRVRLVLLEEISLKSVPEKQKTDVSKEVKEIKKSLSRIEEMSKMSSSP